MAYERLRTNHLSISRAVFAALRITEGLALLIALSVIPQSAWAYIDPGTGSQILQILAAGLLTALFFIKTMWRTIVAWLSQLFRPQRRDTPKERQEHAPENRADTGSADE